MRVLLVDPIADLLPALQTALLSVQGLELYCAPDGATALEHSALLGGVDVLLTEVFLPGVDGLSVRDSLLRDLPRLHTVFLTRHDLSAYSDALHGLTVLPIPVNPEHVSRAVQLVPSRKETTKATPPSVYSAPPSLQNQSKTPEPSDALSSLTDGIPEPSSAAAPEHGHPHSDPQEVTPQNEAAQPAHFQSPAVETDHLESFPTPQKEAPPLYSGASLGPYHIFREDGSHPMGRRYAAVHSTLGRPVHLIVANPETSFAEETRSEFLSYAAAKARVQHASMLAVYEAGEIEGRIFYAIERIDSENLESLNRRSVPIAEGELRDAMRMTAEAFIYLKSLAARTQPLSPSDILLPLDAPPRLNNLVANNFPSPPDSGSDICLLGIWIMAFLPTETPSPLRQICERTIPSHSSRIDDWESLLLALNHTEESSNASDGTLPRATHRDEDPRAQSKLWTKVVFAMVALGLSGFVVLHFLAPTPLVPPQSAIQGGQYIVGGGKRVNLAGFTIDSTEVSNLQYSKFIDWLRSHPNEASRFDHPEQPSHYSHISPEWNEMFPEKKLSERRDADPRWRLPVTQVSWWDAYAFAAWTGRVLPTEEQWEAAGRGTRGFLFPWGDEPEPERANVARADFKRMKGEVDALIPVDELKDKSAAGVSGLSGNVSEWTATRENRKLVAKGGHFNAPLLTLDSRSIIAPDTRSPHLGFRTVSPPEPANP